jgi:hypothetical protein
MTSKESDITVEVTIARVVSGGNTAYGSYHYSFLPSIVDVTRKGTRITYRLTKLTLPTITLTGVYVNCMYPEVKMEGISADRRSLTVVDENQHHQLVILSLRAYDSTFDIHINCDPQITNTPET